MINNDLTSITKSFALHECKEEERLTLMRHETAGKVILVALIIVAVGLAAFSLYAATTYKEKLGIVFAGIFGFCISYAATAGLCFAYACSGYKDCGNFIKLYKINSLRQHIHNKYCDKSFLSFKDALRLYKLEDKEWCNQLLPLFNIHALSPEAKKELDQVVFKKFPDLKKELNSGIKKLEIPGMHQKVKGYFEALDAIRTGLTQWNKDAASIIFEYEQSLKE